LRRLTPEGGQSGDTNQVTISARCLAERNCLGRKLARSLGWGLRVVGFRHGRIRATLHLRGAALRKKRYSVAGMAEGSRASVEGGGRFYPLTDTARLEAGGTARHSEPCLLSCGFLRGDGLERLDCPWKCVMASIYCIAGKNV